MMKSLKLLSVGLVVATSALFSVVAQAAEVALQKVDSRIHGRYGYTWQTMTIDILVDDLAYDKAVTVHYLDDDGVWKDMVASYVQEAGANKEVWRVSKQRSLNSPYQDNQEALDLNFAVKYEVNGEAFWDNNGLQNYFVEAGSGEFITSEVLVDDYYAHEPYDYEYGDNTGHVRGRFSMGVLLKNMGYQKDVTVHYTLNDWQDTYVGTLTFNHGRYYGYSYVSYPNDNGVEYWSFATYGDEVQDTNATHVEFAVSYTVNGVTYWENNQGANYRVAIQQRTP